MGIPVGNAAPALEPIDLPDRVGPDGEIVPGRKDMPVREIDVPAKQMIYRAEHGDESAGLALFRYIVPGITDEEIAGMSQGNRDWILAYATGRLEEVTAYLKNAGAAAAAANSSPPSAPTTSTSTPSPASPARSGKPGGTSRAARSGRRSMPSTV